MFLSMFLIYMDKIPDIGRPLYDFALHRALYRMNRPAALNQPIYATRDTFVVAQYAPHRNMIT